MKAKYNFHELKRRSMSDPLPVDVNAPAEELCKRLGDTAALEELVRARENRKYFGEITVFHDDEGDKKVRALIIVQHGIVPSYKICRFRKDGRLLCERSIHNENVTMAKEKTINEESMI